MILLDTHIWVWWADDSKRLSCHHRQFIHQHREDGLGISAISCWEVAKLVEYGRLKLGCSVEEWLELAVHLPGLRVLELTPSIAVATTKLPGEFHRDPADQIIVATARVYGIGLLTVDEQIVAYEYVQTL